MSILGIGVDTVDVDRFRLTLERTPGVRDRLFTPSEADLPVASLAARFAAKEALIKALRVDQALPWHEMEVATAESGAPSFRLSGTAAHQAAGLTIHVSLSHDGGMATAFVVAERA